MMYKKFENSKICSQKIKEILDCSIAADNRHAYRIIKHTNAIPLTTDDFLPSIMKENNNKMPNESKQINIKITNFGMSLLDNYNLTKQFIELCPAFRNKSCTIAKGIVNEKKGVIGSFENNGHFQFYLFDPVNNNPVSDFKYYNEVGE